MSALPSTERYCPTCERSFKDTKRCPDDGTELVVLAGTTDPLLGRNLNDRYTIQSRLGAGGMGTVYRALQHSVGREVAIKVVNPRLINDAEATKRFLREAKLASRFNHPNAVGMMDFGQTEDGLFYLVMELLSGKTLDAVLRADGRFPLERVGVIAGQICDALEAANKIQVVHRDLKPANVMLLDSGRDLIKVLDFGLAKSLSPDTSNISMTNSGALLGTPAFMSPEAALGRDIDERGDLYSLGVMIYLFASGRMPFNASNTHEMLAMHAHEIPPRPPGVPAQVADVIMKLLAKEPADRYPSAAATRKALDVAILAAKTPDVFTTRMTAPNDAVIEPVQLPASGMDSTIASSPTNTSTQPAPVAANEPSSTQPARSSFRWVLYGLGVAVLFAAFAFVKKKVQTDDRVEQHTTVPADAAMVVPPDAAEIVVDAIAESVVADAGVADAAIPIDAPAKKNTTVIRTRPQDAGVAAPAPDDARPPW